jgi:bifunctional non-homologous end joining protein LigD
MCNLGQGKQEFVIGGYTDPEGSRKYFGALFVGFYEGKKLRFAGRVGTGFSEKLLSTIFFKL